MDEVVNACMSRARWLAAACLLATAPVQVQGQPIPDPTRPPAALIAPAAGANALPSIPDAPQLQSILVSTRQGGRRVAVINGETLRVGGKLGDAVLISIRDTSVVLRRGKQLQTLTLYPASSTPHTGGANAKR